MGCGSANIPNELKESPHYFRQEELSYINEQKEKLDGEIKNGTKKREDSIQPIYSKVDLDFTKRNIFLKEFIVFFIPNNYSKNTAVYDEFPPFKGISEYIEKTEFENNKHYCKINGSSKNIKNFICIYPEKKYDNFKRQVEFEIDAKDKEKNLIILEIGYKIKLYNKLGLYNLSFYFSEDNTLNLLSFSLIADHNFLICHPDKQYFNEISKYKLFAFNKKYISFTLKDKRIKLKIENELDEGLLSNFSKEEINQINISLNTIEYFYGFRHLIYQKVIHNIKDDNRDYIKIYDIVFYPHPSDLLSDSQIFPSRQEQAVIIKKFKINNLLVPKRKKSDEDDNYDDDSEESEFEVELNEEGYKLYDKGDYISGHNILKFNTMFSGVFALFEFDCVSNERLSYLPFNCNYIGGIQKDLIYGAAFKYEVILNGHCVKFSNENDYSIKNGKIIIQGVIDGNKENFNQEEYEKLAKKYNHEWFLDEESETFIMEYWLELRFNELVPKTMKLI